MTSLTIRNIQRISGITRIVRTSGLSELTMIVRPTADNMAFGGPTWSFVGGTSYWEVTDDNVLYNATPNTGDYAQASQATTGNQVFMVFPEIPYNIERVVTYFYAKQSPSNSNGLIRMCVADINDDYEYNLSPYSYAIANDWQWHMLDSGIYSPIKTPEEVGQLIALVVNGSAGSVTQVAAIYTEITLSTSITQWISSVSANSWYAPDNAIGASNQTYASIMGLDENPLIGSFDFSAIPDDKTIKGIEMILYLYSDIEAPSCFNFIKLGVGPTPTWSASVAGNYGAYLVVPSGNHSYTYGNSTDLWGLTITPALLKAGCKVTVTAADPEATNNACYIDAVKLTVYWE